LAYGLYLSLDQKNWVRGDYSTENKLTGTLYINKNKSKVKNLTGYTVKIRLYKVSRIGDRFNKTASVVSASNGTWSYAVQDGDMPFFGLYEVKLELTKSGVKETTLNYTELFVLEGATS
tara:strand:+ start:558 stop:914 length:357 start_codon:yes stop_codon:yes gene_type:complete